ncbi:SCO-spondin, partial [Chaetura pelagica]
VVARGRNLSVNGVAVAQGQGHLQGGLAVTWPGEWVSVATGLGVQVSWDGDGAVTVTVGAELWGGTRGLCGPYNDNPDGEWHR